MEQEREKEKTDKNINYAKSKYGSRKIYDRFILDACTRKNFRVLESDCNITETEFNILIENLDDIVNHITSEKKIHKTNHFEVARVIRIAYSEYVEFLSKLVQSNPEIFYQDSEHREIISLVKPFNPSKKRDILDKYLRMYEAYERNSGIDFYL